MTSSLKGIPQIQSYKGFATQDKIFFKGRILIAKNIIRGHSSSRLRNILDTFRRFRSNELPGIPIQLKIENAEFTTTTDREGYFTFDVLNHQVANTNQDNWIPVSLSLKEYAEQKPINSEIYYPTPNVRVGIISDIDDTILKTHMGSWMKLRMLYHTFTKDGFQRTPMEGMVNAINQFAQSHQPHPMQRPVFYVSNSPWNLYDMIEEFMTFNKIPKGPILLRDFGVKPIENFSGHKMTSFTRIFNTYPNLSFILLGDTASNDADFYLQLAKTYPERIKAIYIRFTDNTKNARRVEKLINEQLEVHARIFRNSSEMLEDANKIQLI